MMFGRAKLTSGPSSSDRHCPGMVVSFWYACMSLLPTHIYLMDRTTSRSTLCHSPRSFDTLRFTFDARFHVTTEASNVKGEEHSSGCQKFSPMKKGIIIMIFHGNEDFIFLGIGIYTVKCVPIRQHVPYVGIKISYIIIKGCDLGVRVKHDRYPHELGTQQTCTINLNQGSIYEWVLISYGDTQEKSCSIKP